MCANIKGLRDVIFSMHLYYACGEVDGSGHRLMDAADVQHELIVHKHPQVVIARELVDDVALESIVAGGLLVRRKLEVDRHAHTKVMVEIAIKVHRTLRVKRIVLMEREEADGLCVGTVRSTRVLRIGVLVELELVGIPIVLGIVRIAVVVVVAKVVALEQAICTCKGIDVIGV